MKFMRQRSGIRRPGLISLAFFFFAVLILITVIWFSLFLVKKWMMHSQAARTEVVCAAHYAGRTQVPFTVTTSYDSDGDGYASCDVYVDGARAESLECDSSYWFNTGKCKAKVLSTH